MKPHEYTLGDIYEEIAEGITIARGCITEGLMTEAKEHLRLANADFMLYEHALKTYPGYQALRHSLRAAVDLAGGVA